MQNDLTKNSGEVLLSFNLNEMVDAQAEINAAKKADKSICLMITETAINFAGYNYLLALLKEARKELKNKVLLQLDHGKNLEIIKRCIKDRFDIVMFDGSNLSFEDNVKLTRKVVNLAHNKEIKVEGAIGKVGDLFKGSKRVDGKATDPQQAKEFLSYTNVDYLAVSVGNYHGNVHDKPSLDLNLIGKLSKQITKPLVLHGADFIHSTILKEAIKQGIRKLNFGPELRYAYWQSIVESSRKITSDDQRDALKLVRSAVDKIVRKRIEDLC